MGTVIAFIGYGEVASTFGRALAARGARIVAHDVLLETPGGLAKLQARACGAEVSFQDLHDAVFAARCILSTVTTSGAVQAARNCAPHLKPGQMYVDLNATDPQTKEEIAGIVSPTGAAFVEGALLGAVGVSGAKTEILLGGPHARRVMTAATESFFRRSGSLGLQPAAHMDEVVRTFNERL